MNDICDIKAINGSYWYKRENCWIVPLNLDNCFHLKKKLKYKFKFNLRQWANNVYKRQERKLGKLQIEGLGGTLLPFQNEGVQLINLFQGRAILGDEMGLGKTVQALAYAQLNKRFRPMLIVCPGLMKYKWADEVRHWIGETDITILEGRTPYPVHPSGIFIINYDILHYWERQLVHIPFELVVIDELHYLKNKGTKKSPVKRTNAALNITRNIRYRLGLTGTLSTGKVLDMFIPLKIINPYIFTNEWKYKHRYCGPKHNGFGWDFDGVSNAQELHNILKEKILIRRLKKDVLKDLPDKQYSLTQFDIDGRGDYDMAEQRYLTFLENMVEGKVKRYLQQFYDDKIGCVTIDHVKLDAMKKQATEKANALTQMEHLRQLCVNGKLDQCIAWIAEFLESGEKLCVFGIHKPFVRKIYEHFKSKALLIAGGTSAKQKAQIEKQFQTNKKYRLLVGNVKAAGIGLTLTAASHIALFEFPWNPDELAQAIDRVHRITQDKKVMVHLLVSRDTVERRMLKTLYGKQQTSDLVLDGGVRETTLELQTIINRIA